MSKNSLNLVIEKQNHIPLLIMNAKLQLKSDKTAPFGGFFFVNKFVKQNGILQLIDNELGKRVRLAGYQYSEIFSALLNIYLCGGDHIEDISYLGQFLRQEPNARIPSSDTIGRANKELAVENTAYQSANHTFMFNFNERLNRSLVRVSKQLGLLAVYKAVDIDITTNNTFKNDFNKDFVFIITYIFIVRK